MVEQASHDSESVASKAQEEQNEKESEKQK